MLVLSRHRDESIMIGDNVVVTIVDIRGDKVRLGIDDSGHHIVADYQVRVARSELTPLQLDADSEAHVVVVVGKNELSLTLNLKAPLIINLQRRLGRQVIVNDDQPLQFELAPRQAQLRKSA